MDSNHHIVITKLIYSQRPFPNWIPTLIMAEGRRLARQWLITINRFSRPFRYACPVYPLQNEFLGGTTDYPQLSQCLPVYSATDIADGHRRGVPVIPQLFV